MALQLGDSTEAGGVLAIVDEAFSSLGRGAVRFRIDEVRVGPPGAPNPVPDDGASVGLFGLAMLGLAYLKRKGRSLSDA